MIVRLVAVSINDMVYCAPVAMRRGDALLPPLMTSADDLASYIVDLRQAGELLISARFAHLAYGHRLNSLLMGFFYVGRGGRLSLIRRRA